MGIWSWVFRIGLVISLLLAGALLVARARALYQVDATSYTPLTGDAAWEGDWEFSELGADPSEAGTERVSIPFVGTGLALEVRRGNYRGTFFVSVDGVPANRLPRDERGAYLVLTSPDYEPEIAVIRVAGGLVDGPHVAEIVAERGWDQWPLAGWRVSRGSDTRPYDWALFVSAALGLASIAGLVRRPVRAMVQEARRTRHDARDGTRAGPVGGPAGFSARQLPFYIPHPPAPVALIAMLICAGAFYASPWLPLTVISGLALAALILLRLDLGLAVVAAAAPFYLHPRSLLGKAFSMVEIILLLCVLSWGLRQAWKWIGRLPRPRQAPQPASPIRRSLSSIVGSLSLFDLAALCFLIVAVASFFVAEHRHVALRELRVLIFEPALFYLLLRTSNLDGRDIWRIVDLFVLGAVAVALIGIVQYALGVDIITAEEGFRRLRSVYGSPNSVGLYLGRALPVLVAVALFGASRRRRVVYALAIVPVGLAVLFSFSKGALILGVPLSLLVLGLLAGGRWRWAALGGAAVALVAAVPLLRTPRFPPLLDTSSGTTFFRISLWRSSWAMFRGHPWLGVGPDNFLYQFRSRYILPAAWQEPNISQAHNILLDYGTRMGIVGIAVGGLLQIAFWRVALPLRRSADADRRALALGLMGSMANFLAHGLVDASYFLIDLAFAFFMTASMVEWLARSAPDEFEA
jgi:O-antigen ligase